jgi:hypothetical protein
MTFSTTLREGTIWKNWNKIPTDLPLQAESSSAPSSRMFVAPMRMPPLDGASIPVRRFTRVVLPLPDLPTMVMNSPDQISRLTSRRAQIEPAAVS